MIKKKKVVVIDSGIDKTDQLLQNVTLQDLYYEDGELKQQYQGKVNSHGTEIIKVLLRETSDIEIISIRVLNEQNRCLLSDIINAIKYCIEIQADIVNLSLGSCAASAKRIHLLEQVCLEAQKKNIVIFAADHNLPGMKSYPANFDCVIGVTTSEIPTDICQVAYQERIVEFSDNMVYIPDAIRCTIRQGNSYLCPLLAGLFSSFIGTRKIDPSVVESFIDYLEQFSQQQNASKIFFNKYETTENEGFRDKRILFFADDMDINNMRLYGMYKQIGNVELCFDAMVGQSMLDVEAYVQKADIFFFGAISNQFLNENQAYLNDLVKLLEKQQKMTITVFPIINTYQRICLTAENSFQMRSIYK